MDNLTDSLWVEKWRPKKLTDVVLEKKENDFLEKCIAKKEIPHTALFGPPGSGKTTCARILVDELISDNMDVLELNGSDSTGVDVMRNDVASFLKCPAYSSKHKIVFIDEADYLTNNAQAILRNMMEKYYEAGRFIFTANYPSKIMDALKSRLQIFEMKKLSDDHIFNHCKHILDSENVKFNDDNIKLLIQNLSPDVRKIINVLQQHVVNGEIQNLDMDSIIGIEKKIAGLICMICDSIEKNPNDKLINTNIADIHNLVCNDDIDYMSAYDFIYNHDIPLWAKIEVNKYANMHQQCAIPYMHFIAMCWSIVQNGKAYSSMFNK